MLNRILRGNYQEGLRYLTRLPLDSDLAFIHHFEQRRLGFRRGAVDLVCQEDVGERSEEHTSELQSRFELVCRLLLEKKKASRSENRAKRAGRKSRRVSSK